MTLDSDFHGPIRFRLYRFSTRTAWQEVDAAGLGRLTPEQRWTRTFEPLEKNNHGRGQWPVPVERLREGYYLLTAEARYAPMLAACKFSVSNVTVYLRAGRNEAVAVAVDRRDGRPVPNLPLRLHITGRADAQTLCKRLKPVNEEAFLRGFRGDPAEVQYDSGPAAEAPHPARARRATIRSPMIHSPTAPRQTCRFARGERTRTIGSRPRRTAGSFRPIPVSRPPPAYGRRSLTHKAWRHAAAGPRLWRIASCARGPMAPPPLSWILAGGRYCYTLEVQRVAEPADAGPQAHVAVDYQEPTDTPYPWAAVWLAQSVHRPGDTVDFAGLVRRFHGASPAPAANRPPVVVTVANRNGTLWEGQCAVTPGGDVLRAVPHPADDPHGLLWFDIDGVRAEPPQPLAVEEFRTTTFRVGLSLPRGRYAGGQRLEGKVDVTYFTGKPAAGADVEVALVIRGEQQAIRGTTAADGSFRFSLPVPTLPNDAYAVVRTRSPISRGSRIRNWNT